MKRFYDLDLLENQVFGAGPEEEDPPWEQVEEWETPKDLEGGRTVTLTLTVDEQTQIECRVIGVFLESDKEYIALELPQSQVQLMGLEPGEDDGIELVSIQEEEEQERVTERFMELFVRDGGLDGGDTLTEAFDGDLKRGDPGGPDFSQRDAEVQPDAASQRGAAAEPDAAFEPDPAAGPDMSAAQKTESEKES